MSTEGNKQLLDDLIDALDLAVQRGRIEARENRDTRSLNAIDGYLAQQFAAAGDETGSEGEGQPTPPASGTGRFVYDPVTKTLVPR